MVSNIKTSAYPYSFQMPSKSGEFASQGLSKREYFAGLAMQGLSSSKESIQWTFEQIAEYSVKQADALIKELNK